MGYGDGYQYEIYKVKHGTGATRMTLLTPLADGGYKPYATGDGTSGKIYVAENILSQEDVDSLAEKVDGDNRVYWSKITSTKTKAPSYLYYYTAAQLLGDTVITGIDGMNDYKGLGSGINLYDNQMEFPESGKRQIFVRHLDIDTNEVISDEIVDVRKVFTPTATPITANVYGDINGIITSNNKDYSEFQEVYAGDTNTPKPNEAVGIKVLQMPEYKAYGSSITISKTTFADGIVARDAKIREDKMPGEGSIQPVSSTQDMVVIPKMDTKSDDFVFVDIYYKRPKINRLILVRHIGLNKGTSINLTNVKNGITFPYDSESHPTKTLTNGNTVQSNTNGYLYEQEVYNLKDANVDAGITLERRTDISGYTYKGFVANGAYNIVPETAFNTGALNRDNSINLWNTSTKDGNIYGSSANTTRTISARPEEYKYQYHVAFIDFYYEKNDDIPAPTAALSEPLTLENLKGKISYEKGSNSYFDEENNIAYVPSSDSIKTGITDAYKYMLGGINIKKTETNNVNGSDLTTENTTWNIEHNIVGVGQYTYTYYSCSHSSHSGIEYTSGGDHDHSYTTCSGSGEDRECTDNEDIRTLSKETGTKSITKGASKNYTYKVPVKLTYYTVPNMKIFTVKNANIYNQQDSLNNLPNGPITKGLPFFDGGDKTISITDTYKTQTQMSIYGLNNSVISGADPAQRQSNIARRSNYESVARYGDTWTDDLNVGTISKYQEQTDSNARAAAQADLNAAVGRKLADPHLNEYETNAASTDRNPTTVDPTFYEKVAINADGQETNGAYVNFKVQNTQIKINDTTIVEPNLIDRNVLLKYYDDEGFNTDAWTNDAAVTDSVEKSWLVKNTENIWYNDFDCLYPGSKYSSSTTKRITTSGTNSIKDFYYPSAIVSFSHFTNNEFNIPVSRLNGERVIAGKINYEIDNRNSIGNENSFADTEWYRRSGTAADKLNTSVIVDYSTSGAFLNREWIIKNDSSNSSNVQIANIYTPISARGVLTTDDTTLVNHTEGDISGNVIQKNSTIKITCYPQEINNGYGRISEDTIKSKYLKCYYVKFDFDTENVRIDNVLYKQGIAIAANEWIGPISKTTGDNYVTAQAVKNPDTANMNAVFDANSNKITVMAIANNIPVSPGNLQSNIATGAAPESSYVDQIVNERAGATSLFTTIIQRKYYGRIDLAGASNYAAKDEPIETKNLSRIFDFKITDLKDISWKDVFRKNEGDNPNVHTGNLYYAGITKWNFYSLELNNIISRTTSEIGSEPKRVLPIGPYKSTIKGYVGAPKLGYRFSYDVKTTGKVEVKSNGLYDGERKVTVQPSFYFVSKKVKTDTANKGIPQVFLMRDEYIKPIATKDEWKRVELFYKNNKGKYIMVGSSEDVYKMAITPKDGYRYTAKGEAHYNDNNMSTKTVSLSNKVTDKMVLDKQTMSISNNTFVQTWYGEYKLPNSTIAVEVTRDSAGKETYDINKPLTDGYIGVIFDIKAKVSEDENDASSIWLGYNIEDKEKSASTNNSQWDYEGYAGYTSYGKSIDSYNGLLKMQLEKGLWDLKTTIRTTKIPSTLSTPVAATSEYYFYNKIKGTVILYDADNRAANDFN